MTHLFTPTIHPLWTPEDEQFLIETHGTLLVRQQAEHLGRAVKDVAAKRVRLHQRGVISIFAQAFRPRWTRVQDEWLRDNYHRYTMRTLMRKLGRTETAIVMRKRKLDIRRSDGFYTAMALAEVFGCDAKRVTALVQEGYLRGSRAPYLQGKKHPWVFTERNVRKFIRSYPWLLRPQKMQHHFYRSLVMDEWTRDPWYNCKQAAVIVGIGEDALQKRFRSGEIPASQRSPNRKWSHWLIRRSALLANFKRHDTREIRSRQMRDWQVSRRRRQGLPMKLYAVWEVTCPECGAIHRIRAHPKAWTKQVLELASNQHQCRKEVPLGSRGADGPDRDQSQGLPVRVAD